MVPEMAIGSHVARPDVSCFFFCLRQWDDTPIWASGASRYRSIWRKTCSVGDGQPRPSCAGRCCGQ